MRRQVAEWVLNFLFGLSWALALIGALYGFYAFYTFGLFAALLAAAMGSAFGLFLVIVCELVYLQFEKMRELCRQTQLLEMIAGVGPKNSDDRAEE